MSKNNYTSGDMQRLIRLRSRKQIVEELDSNLDVKAESTVYLVLEDVVLLDESGKSNFLTSPQLNDLLKKFITGVCRAKARGQLHVKEFTI